MVPVTTELPPTTPPAPRWHRYVAIGDSFTEGLWDREAEGSDACRGWADRLAEHLDARTPGGTEYANLAVRGRLLGPILTDQLPAALDLQPDLVSIVGGGNDILRPGVDVDRLADRLENAVVRVRETGADVLLATGVDADGSALLRLTRPRVATFNAHVWSIARRHGAFVLDQWGMRFIKDWRLWDVDRLHLTSEGHRRVAEGALEALGLEPTDPAWNTPLDAPDTEAWAVRARENAVWMRQHALPWMQRRLTGRSSGDGRSAKRPAPAAPGSGAAGEHAAGAPRDSAGSGADEA
ncbi:SGNH/GDSL hydrolase family protein [Sanguibacter sp. HDW7]|uniref:SGNH/GDSL hydrolase family protein n=1 Tax=Sanguibacter sp. HDW7 TaxID=2714931 RepID=UPI00140E2C6D|nr:SGNH/GDSL hydrolase family protein [Sanguibacter sp. HDW7]